MSRPIEAVVSLGALSHNLQQARSCAPDARTWAVVKANAYGHGLAAAVRGFAQADGLALIEFDAALRLRELGWQRPILMLEGAFAPADIDLAARHGLSLAVHDGRQLQWLRDHRGPAVDVWLKIDTGLNRLGFKPDQAGRKHAELNALSGVGKVSLMSHFAEADRPGGADAAIDCFDRAVAGLPAEQSLANSAAVLDLPVAHRQWTRPGIMLYGATPFGQRTAASLGLTPAMSLRSELIAVRQLVPGDTVGYGCTFVAPAPMRIGIVACGYADGYPRHAPTGTPIAVAGVRTRTLGRVSMDMTAVDITHVAHADVGAPVEIWGDQVPIDEVAASAGTIGYELMCALAPRVPLRLQDD